jgi:hypothetical protein
MKRKVILPLLLTAIMIAGCGSKGATDTVVETAKTEAHDNRPDSATEQKEITTTTSGTSIKRTDDTITLPDGRTFPMSADTAYTEIGDEDDKASYSMDGLKESFEHIDIRFAQEGKDYYFTCDMECNDGNVEWKNIDTNLSALYEDSYMTDSYGIGVGTSDYLGIGDINKADGQCITINGIKYDSKTYLNEARAYFMQAQTPFTEIYQTGESDAEIYDYWRDADDNDFRVSMYINEAENSLENGMTQVFIGY